MSASQPNFLPPLMPSAHLPQPSREEALAPPWRALWRFDTLDSTQHCARQLVKEGHDLSGIAIWADRQTSGHGRFDRAWHSKQGGIYITVGLPVDPTAPPAGVGWLPLLAAQSCVEVLHDYQLLAARIKWPNDILVQGRKVAGVLGELARIAPRPDAPQTPPKTVALLGMGINWLNDVNADARQYGFTAASVGDFVPRLALERRGRFVRRWLARLAGWHGAWMNDPATTEERLRAAVEGILWRRGELMTFQATEEGTVRGRLVGLGSSGAACLELENGRILEVHCGQTEAAPSSENERQ